MYSGFLGVFFNDKQKHWELTHEKNQHDLQLTPDQTAVNDDSNDLYSCNLNRIFLVFGFCVWIYSPDLKRGVGLNYA